MYRTLVTRSCLPRVYPRVNLHLTTLKLAEASSKDAQPKSSANSTDEVKFDYINKTGLILLNKPKALNALSLSMVQQIYPKMKVRRNIRKFTFSKNECLYVGMGIGWQNRISNHQEYDSESILCWW